MQPFEEDHQGLCHTKNEVSGVALLRKSKCWLIENCGPKSVLANTGISSRLLLRASARRKIIML